MRLSDQSSKDEREERSWRSIFDVFDENQDGIFDRSELRVLLTKFSTATEGKITEIIELLDDDKSGEISFDEFYAFGRKLERYVRENVDPHELLKEMFEIVDDDRRGLGVPRCYGAFTPSTRLVSTRRGRGWFLFLF